MKSRNQIVEDSKAVVLGVDIGGTNTKFGFVDRAGKCLASASMPTDADQPAGQFFQRLQRNANLLFGALKAEHELAGIGIGAPNANYHKGTIEHPPNLGWDFVDVRAELASFFSVPSAVTNDANAAALGEMLFGAARGMKDFIVITLGTGLGSGIVANGELIYGADGFAGEIGHTIVDPNGRRCGCGQARLPGSLLLRHGIVPDSAGTDLQFHGTQRTPQSKLRGFDRARWFPKRRCAETRWRFRPSSPAAAFSA